MIFSFDSRIEGDLNIPGFLELAPSFQPQVEQMIIKAGPVIRQAEEVALPGQPVAAVLMTAAMEGVYRLPTITLLGFGGAAGRVGSFNLDEYRHNEVRLHRSELKHGEHTINFTVLSASQYGLADFQLQELAQILDTGPEEIRVLDVSMGQVLPDSPAEGVVGRLVDSGLVMSDSQTGQVLFLPPGLGTLSAVMATAIYGLIEVWPRTIRLDRGNDGKFHVVEVVDPRAIWQRGRQLAAEWEGAGLEAKLNSFAGVLLGYGARVSVDGNILAVVFPNGETFELTVSAVKHTL